MEKEKTFVTNPIEKPKSSRIYERQELESDISVFPEKSRSIIRKYLEGQNLMPGEQSIFDKELAKWWQDKYGFPYGNNIARNETLLRKYAPPQERIEENRLQEALFQALKDNNDEEIEKIKKFYESTYPDQLEGITALFELNSFFNTNEQMKRHKNWDEEKLKMVEQQTQYQFLLTDFVAHNSQDKEFLSVFWAAAERLAEKTNHLRELNLMRKAVLSQVAIFKVLEALGFNPKISHPKEDSFSAIDIWADQEKVIQIKGDGKSPVIIETKTIGFPGIELEQESQVNHYDSQIAYHFYKFQVKISEYGHVIGKNLKGYLISVPYEKFDFITGEPDKEFAETINQQLKR